MDVLKFAQTVGKLKRLKRTGWVENHVPDPESVAEHIFRVALLTMVLAPKFGADQLKSVKMALIHDLGEAQIKDIITSRKGLTLKNLGKKTEMEQKSLEKIQSFVDTEEFIKLFEEFEENKTTEARFVRQLDKLEMGIQALEYENQYSFDLEEFFISTKSGIKDILFLKLYNQIERLRKKS